MTFFNPQRRPAFTELDDFDTHNLDGTPKACSVVAVDSDRICEQVLDGVRSVTDNVKRLAKKENSMIEVVRNNRPEGGRSNPGVQFLSPKHVTTKEGFLAQISEVTTEEPDNFGNPYVVYFENGATKYSKGFKSTSDLLISLVDMLGADEKKWIGQTVRIKKTTDKRSGAERLQFAKK